MKRLFRKLVPSSIRGRLSLLFSIVFGAALILTSFVCFKVFTRTYLHDFDAFLFNHAVDLASTIDTSHLDREIIITDPPNDRKKHRLFSVERTYSQLSDKNENILGRSLTLTGKRTLPHHGVDYLTAARSGASYRTVKRIDFSEGRDSGKPYRLITYALPQESGPPLVLRIAAPLTLLEEENRELLLLLAILIPFTLLVSGGLGYWASHRAFSPVIRMAQKTAQIEMKSLKERIEVKESDAELKELGKTLNQLLERVENAFSAQERFIADSSHQLKTPLSIVRGELELLQARPGHPAEVTEALSNTSQEVSQLISLVENLLLLARMDAGLGMLSFQSIRLDELLSEAMTRLQYVAKKKNIKLTSELQPDVNQPEANIDFEFRGDSDLIRCLMENLIENAIKYSPEKGQVTARLSEDRAHYTLEVSDGGKGMSEEEVSKIFNRFWRDPKKSLAAPGAGLGLSIANKISEIHGGSISVISQPGKGSTFTVRLSKS
jgi:signal transduction histidine kinase